MTRRAASWVIVLLAFIAASHAADDAKPVGEPVLDPPTLESLGVYWVVRGDDNRNARVDLDWRKQGETAWHAGAPLLRVGKGMHKHAGKEAHDSLVEVPADAWLFAGSVMFLAPDTAYDLRLRLTDPDGGKAEKLLKDRTIAEPTIAKDVPRRHVVVGAGGGSGSAADPFKGLVAAQKAAKPGDVFLIHAGVYAGTFEIEANGEPGKPIVWMGAGDGEAAIDGGGAERAVAASGHHDLWFEGLAIRHAGWGLVAHDCARVVIKRCHFTGVHSGITAGRNTGEVVRGFFITDNVLEGPFKWLLIDDPGGKEQWDKEYRGIELSGAGHVICHNRVHHFKDAIDTFPSRMCAAIDICDNELSQLIDDAIEMDGSERNTRCFRNRITDVHQGISVQPIFGGPVYVVRNSLYNVQVEPFKMHNSPSGGIFLHNTVVKRGPLLMLSTQDAFSNFLYRNNLFIGSEGRAVDIEPPATDCDLDNDGFGGFSGEIFMKFNGVRYKTLAEARAKAPIERRLVVVDPATAFAAGVHVPEDPRVEHAPLDLRLKPGTAAIDAGVPLPGIDDGFTGAAPDLGAYEVGAALPAYGPRPELRP